MGEEVRVDCVNERDTRDEEEGGEGDMIDEGYEEEREEEEREGEGKGRVGEDVRGESESCEDGVRV